MSEAKKPRNPDFEAAVRASFARQGLMRTIAARIAHIEPGRVVLVAPYSDAVGQQQGLFHGAVIGAVADTAAGYAAMSLMPTGSEVLTIEYKINFMRPARGTLLRAMGEVMRSGKTVSVVRADIQCGDGAEMVSCGLLQATMMRVEP